MLHMGEIGRKNGSKKCKKTKSLYKKREKKKQGEKMRERKKNKRKQKNKKGEERINDTIDPRTTKNRPRHHDFRLILYQRTKRA